MKYGIRLAQACKNKNSCTAPSRLAELAYVSMSHRKVLLLPKVPFPHSWTKIVLLTCFDVLEGIEDSGGSGLDEDEIAPAVERTPLRIGSRPLSSPVLVSHLSHQLFT